MDLPTGEITGYTTSSDTVYFDFNLTSYDYRVNGVTFKYYDNQGNYLNELNFDIEFNDTFHYENASISDFLPNQYTVILYVNYQVDSVDQEQYIDEISFNIE